jgi:hypothetical protein
MACGRLVGQEARKKVSPRPGRCSPRHPSGPYGVRARPRPPGGRSAGRGRRAGGGPSTSPSRGVGQRVSHWSARSRHFIFLLRPVLPSARSRVRGSPSFRRGLPGPPVAIRANKVIRGDDGAWHGPLPGRRRWRRRGRGRTDPGRTTTDLSERCPAGRRHTVPEQSLGGALLRWNSTTDHKVIGLMYRVTAFGLPAGRSADAGHTGPTRPPRTAVRERAHLPSTLHDPRHRHDAAVRDPMFVGFANAVMPRSTSSPPSCVCGPPA